MVILITLEGFVGVARLELTTLWSQTRYATNCATPRIELRSLALTDEALAKSVAKEFLSHHKFSEGGFLRVAKV